MTGGFYGRSKRFNVESSVVESVSKQRIRYVVEICIAVFLVILGFVFMNMEEDSYEYEKSAREIFGILKFLCFGIAGIMSVSNIVLLYALSVQENVLCRIYICLHDEGIEGVKCNCNKENAVPFQIYYDDLVDVTLGWDAESRTNKICFRTTSQRIECFFIENATAIVGIVNEKLAEYQEKHQEYENEQVSDNKVEESVSTVYTMKQGANQVNPDGEIATKYCMYCGIKISKEALFCSSCGKKQ